MRSYNKWKKWTKVSKIARPYTVYICPKCNKSTTVMTPHCAHCGKRLVRGKLLEDKCKFCHLDSDDYSCMFGAFWLYPSVHEGWKIHAGKCKSQKVDYCPKCGRKLNQNDKNNKH